MPNIKSQVKRLRQAKKHRRHNRIVKLGIKARLTDFRKAYVAKDKKKAAEFLKVTVKALDKAAAKGVIHPNQAANKKSALMKKFSLL